MSLLWSLVAKKSWYIVRQEKGAIRARGGSKGDTSTKEKLQEALDLVELQLLQHKQPGCVSENTFS